MHYLIPAIGFTGAISGGISARFWFAASRVKPVYNTAMLGGNPEEKKRTDKMVTLNARAAISAGIAVSCQAILLAIDAWSIAN